MPLSSSHKTGSFGSTKTTQWIHHHLDGDRPLDVAAMVNALLGEGFIGQLRIHFDGSHARVGRGEIVVKQSISTEPLTNSPSTG